MDKVFILELLKTVYEELKERLVTVLQSSCSPKQEICRPVSCYSEKTIQQETSPVEQLPILPQIPVEVKEEVKEQEIPPAVVPVSKKRKRTKKSTKIRSK